MHRLLGLRVPAVWFYELRLLFDFNWRLHDLNGQEDEIALSEFVPSIVLDKETEGVLNAECFSLARG
jgi:hypothetical protein